MLIINNGLLGDLIISSVILTNDKILTQNHKCYYLINKKYRQLFVSYQGKISILYWDLEKYRTNIIYRIRFIQKIRALKVGLTVNIRFGRRIIEDELTYLSGAEMTSAFELNESIIKLHKNRVDRKYTKIMKRKTGNDFNDLCLLFEEITLQSIKRETKLYPGKTHKIIHKISGVNIFDYKKFIVVSPFSSQLFKNWQVKNYFALLEWLSKLLPDFILIIVGDNSQKKYFKAQKKYSSHVLNCIGMFSLNEICQLISKASLFIGNDSGLLHMAKTYNIPRIGIVGGGSFGIIHPYGNIDNEILLYKSLPCLGCNWNCPKKNYLCLTDVSQTEILCAVKNLTLIN